MDAQKKLLKRLLHYEDFRDLTRKMRSRGSQHWSAEAHSRKVANFSEKNSLKRMRTGGEQ
jgi:hypothetical protein